MDEVSFGVIFNDTSAGEYGRPLLLVRTQSKTEEEDTSFSQKRLLTFAKFIVVTSTLFPYFP